MNILESQKVLHELSYAPKEKGHSLRVIGKRLLPWSLAAVFGPVAVFSTLKQIPYKVSYQGMMIQEDFNHFITDSDVFEIDPSFMKTGPRIKMAVKNVNNTKDTDGNTIDFFAFCNFTVRTNLWDHWFNKDGQARPDITPKMISAQRIPRPLLTVAP